MKNKAAKLILLILLLLLFLIDTSFAAEPTPTPTPDNSTPTPTPDNSTPTPTPDNSTPTPTPDNSTPASTPDNSTPASTPDTITSTTLPLSSIVTFSHVITPSPPIILGGDARDYVHSTDGRKNNIMDFSWRNEDDVEECSSWSPNFEEKDYHYISDCEDLDSPGHWHINVTEYRGAEIVGTGDKYFIVTDAPEFSSYPFAIISLVFVYFVLRKKL
jgi:hypothetical protein